jgi:hypothetical protein
MARWCRLRCQTALLAALLQAVTSSGHAAQRPDLVFEVKLEQHVLSDAIGAYQQDGQVLLPLGEMARLLTLAIRTDPGQHSASGYILDQARAFRLDLAAATVTIGAVTESFPPALARREEDDIYIASGLLARWLPADFEIDLASLALRVTPRERLPLQARFDRSRRQPGRAAGGRADPGYPRAELPYQLASVPFADQTLGLDLRRSHQAREQQLAYTAYLTGDLLGAEAALYVSTGSHRHGRPARLVLGRHDPDGRLLGPLRARTVQIGSIVTPSVAHIAHSNAGGNGVLLSNRALGQPSRTDRHSLRGDLPPGWDVELYVNDALVGIQSSRPDGRYAFDDQPLVYGANELRLLFHGPLGQVRVERHSFLIEQSMLAEGELAYSLTALHGDGERRLGAQFEWGLHRRLSASAGLAALPLYGTDRRYAYLGMHAYLDNVVVDAALVRANGEGSLLQVGARTSVGGVAMSASHARAANFTSEIFSDQADTVRTRNEARVDGVLATMPVSVLVTHDRLASGARRMALSARLSAYRRGTAISNALHWRAGAGYRQADGLLQLSRRVAGIGLGAQLHYLLKPEARLGAAMLSADRYFGTGYQANLGLSRTFIDAHTRATIALNKRLGSFGLGVNAFRTSRGDYGAGVQLFLATGRDPRSARWLVDATPLAGSGAAAMHVFLDRNRNGVRDQGELPIAGAGFTVNASGHLARTDAAGNAWLGRLPAHQHVDIGIDASTLDDPQWQPVTPGLRMVPRAGKVGQFDLAIGVTGEIDGSTWRLAGGVRKPAGDLEIELLDAANRVVARTTSAADGYYVLAGVAPGSYRLQLAPAQLARLGFAAVAPVAVLVDDEGNFVNGQDFTVTGP